MINGLGVVGWGVGGIEAEAVMLGQPIYMLMPEVIGFRLTGELPEGATATDYGAHRNTNASVLWRCGTVCRILLVRVYKHFRCLIVLRSVTCPPSTVLRWVFFPIDEATLGYLRRTGRDDDLIELVEQFTKDQGLFLTPDAPEPEYLDVLSIGP